MIRGVLSFLSGLRLVLFRPELRAILWRMLIVLAVLLIVLTVGALWLSDVIVARFIPTGDAWYVDFMAWLLRLFSLVLALAVGIVAYVVLGSVAASPWLEKVCLHVERLDGEEIGTPDRPWWQCVGISMWNAVMPLAAFLPWALFATVLLLLPVYGTVVASLVWAWAGLRLLGFEFMDTPASRRGWTWQRRQAEMDANEWFYLGFTGAASVLMVIPVLNLFVLPAAVAGLSRAMPKSEPDDHARESPG